DLRQRALGNVSEEVVAILEMLGALARAGRVACEIVERLVMRLEREAGRGVDDGALLARRVAAVGERGIPAAGVPGPRDAFRRQRVADGFLALRRQRVARGIREIGIAAGRRRHAAWLVGRLRRVD